MPVARWIDFRQSRVQLPMNLSMARVTKDFLQSMVNQFVVTSRLNKGEASRQLCLFLVKVERQDTYALTDGAQVVLSKRIRGTDQDWSKKLLGISGQLWRRQNHCHQEESRSITSSTNRHSSRACNVEVSA